MRQLAILAVAVVAILAAPSAARCDDLDDLKAAHAAFFAALNALDTNSFPGLFHEEAIAFLHDVPFPIRKPTKEFLKTRWAELERHQLQMIAPQYVVVGTTGIVWGHRRRDSKVKDGPGKTDWGRAMYTYVKSGGKWLHLATHVSAIPS